METNTSQYNHDANTEHEEAPSSLTRSLQEIMEIEQERLAQEEHRKQEELRREREQQVELRRQRLEARKAEARRRLDEQRAERQQQREENARIAAAREAVLLGAEKKAHDKARRAEFAQHQQHERLLAEIQGDRQKTRMKRALGVLAITVSFGAAVGFSAFNRVEQRSSAQVAAALRTAEQIEREAEERVRQLEDRLDHAEVLAQVETSKLEAELKQARQALEDAHADVEKHVEKQAAKQADSGQRNPRKRLAESAKPKPAPAKAEQKESSKANEVAVEAEQEQECLPYDPLCFTL